MRQLMKGLLRAISRRVGIVAGSYRDGEGLVPHDQAASCCRARERRWRVAPSRARVQLLPTLTKTAQAPPARIAAAAATDHAHRWLIGMPAVDHTGLRALTPVVKTQKAAGAVRHRPLCLSQAPISSA